MKPRSSTIKICDHCGAVHVDDMTCPVCQLMEFIMKVEAIESLKQRQDDYRSKANS